MISSDRAFKEIQKAKRVHRDHQTWLATEEDVQTQAHRGETLRTHMEDRQMPQAQERGLRGTRPGAGPQPPELGEIEVCCYSPRHGLPLQSLS